MPKRSTFLLTLFGLSLISGVQAQNIPVRVGFFPNLTHAPVLVALGKGYLGAQLKGAELQTKTFSSGTTLSEAFAAGAIDIGLMGPGPAINAAARGQPLQIVAGAAEGGAVLIARRGSGIHSYKDLGGKNVAVPSLGNTQDISLRAILQANNLRDVTAGGTVTVVPLDPAGTAAAFVSKQVDAALLPEPWAALLEEQGSSAIGSEKTVWRSGKYPSAVVVVNTKFAQQHPDLVRGFLKAQGQATAFIQKSPAAAQSVISGALQKLSGQSIDPRALQRALSRTHFSTQLDTEALKAYGNLSLAAGYTRQLPDFGALVNLSYLK